MNRVWKVIEEHKHEMHEEAAQKKMSEKSKKSQDYEEGVKDGMYAALSIIKDYIAELDED